MLEKLRNMEPLPGEEEYKIRHRLRMIVLLLAGIVMAFAIWSIVNKKELSTLYYVIIAVFLSCNWLLTDVGPIFLCRALAGRTDRQVSAYFKLVGLGLLGNVGLGWFLFAMNNQSIYGAIAYLVSSIWGRKQRDIYYGVDKEEAAAEETVKKPEAKPDHLPTAADRLKRLNELSAQADGSSDAEVPADESDGAEAPAETLNDTEAPADTGANDGSV